MEKELRDKLLKFFDEKWWNEDRILKEVKDLLSLEKRAHFREQFLTDLDRIIKVYGKNGLGYNDDVVNSIDVDDIALSIKMRLDGARQQYLEEKKNGRNS